MKDIEHIMDRVNRLFPSMGTDDRNYRRIQQLKRAYIAGYKAALADKRKIAEEAWDAAGKCVVPKTFLKSWNEAKEQYLNNLNDKV